MVCKQFPLKRVKAGLVLVGCVTASFSGWAEARSGPASLEARLKAHPIADAYAALGNWFDENHKTDCALESFQSGLKLEPD
jgi:hypothetical protein